MSKMKEKKLDTLKDLKEITRVEVIDKNGRSYVNLNAKDVKISLQDEYRTLKIFVN